MLGIMLNIDKCHNKKDAAVLIVVIVAWFFVLPFVGVCIWVQGLNSGIVYG